MRAFVMALGRPSRMSGRRLALVTALALAAPASFLTADRLVTARIVTAIAASTVRDVSVFGQSLLLAQTTDLRLRLTGRNDLGIRDAGTSDPTWTLCPPASIDQARALWRNDSLIESGLYSRRFCSRGSSTWVSPPV